MKKTILVTGANGQLGSEIRNLSSQLVGYHFIFTDYQELSIIDEEAVNVFFKRYQPDYCINCAAYTAVDKAEDPKEFDLVNSLNAIAVGYLASASNLYGTKFLHISTDYVFDGTASAPMKEKEVPNPMSVYGRTKLEGENYALQANAIVIRTAWVYSSYGKNFVKTMIHLMNTKESLNVVNDQLGSPTYAADLAKVILDIIDSAKWEQGIYHYTNDGIISWYDFAVAIKELISSNCIVNPIPTSAYPTPAQRPAYSVLDKSKIKQIYNINGVEWKDSLALCIKKLVSEKE